MTTILLPFTYFFYESNEDNDYKTRFCTAFGNVIILLVVFCCINFPMFTSWRHALVPVDSVMYDLRGIDSTAAASPADVIKLNQVFLVAADQSTDPKLPNSDMNVWTVYDNKLTLDTQLTFAAYMIGATAFWGNAVFLFFVSTGLIAIPFEHIIAWVDQPKPMHSEGDFKKEKEELAKTIKWVLDKGKSVYDKKVALDQELDEGGTCTKIAKYGKIRA